MRKFLHRVLLLVNVVAGLALILSYLAVHISPETFVIPAYFGLAYPYILLGNVILALTWAVLLRFEFLISLSLIAIGYTHLSNYIRIGRNSSVGNGTIRIVSYNVRLFNNLEKGAASSESGIMDYISKEQADIICLQEFYLSGNRVVREAEIRRKAGKGYNSHIKVISRTRDRYYGIVTFTRFPVVNRGEIIHPASSSLSIFTDVIIEGDTVRIYNNHLQSFRLKAIEKSFLEEITSNGEDETTSRVRSLAASLRNGFIQRARQADVVKEHIDNSPYPVIVAGDFNDTPVSYSYRRMRKGLNDSFVHSGNGAGFTYKGKYPANRIDYILYDDSFESTEFRISRVKFSDHYPVSATLRMASEKADF